MATSAGEAIYLGPTLATANGVPGVPTQTSVNDFAATKHGARAIVSHTELQVGWESPVEVDCRDLDVSFHPGRSFSFSVQIGEAGPILNLQNGKAYALQSPEGFRAAQEAALESVLKDEAGLGAAHRAFPAFLQHFGFVAGFLTAKACAGR